MPSFAAHLDVALELEPHQIRSQSLLNRARGAAAPADWETWTGVGFRRAIALQQFEERFSVAPRHIGGRLAVTRRIAEIPPAVDHLFR